MSLQRCQDETSSTEFLDWLEYLEQGVNVRRREDYYLAQIAREIRRTVVKNPQNVALKSFLLEFEIEKPVKEKRKSTLKRWLAWAGLKA